VAFDLIVRGGEVIDGTGGQPFRADVAIHGDRIVAVGQFQDAEAGRVIDASGMVVAPGFIDVHNHSDGWLLKEKNFQCKTLQGFSTEVLMADGISYAPVDRDNWREWIHYLRPLNGLSLQDYDGWETLGDYMQRLDGRTAQNVATHVPYANIRALVNGFGSRPIDDSQAVRIRRLIEREMDAGAVGLSTGLDYIAQNFSTTDELVDACRPVAERGGFYVTHVRYKRTLIPALEEAFEIGRRAQIPVHISHLKIHDPPSHEEVFAAIERAEGDGVEVTFDVYPYQSGSTMLNYILPYEIWEDGPLAATAKMADPVVGRRVIDAVNAYRRDLDQLRLAWVHGNNRPDQLGMTLQQIVEESGKSAADALLDLLIGANLAVLCVVDEGDDTLVEPMLQHPRCMIGTDGIYQPGGHVHPRVYGSSGRLLGELVRDKKLMSLAEAVHKMTGLPAWRFGLTGRGEIKADNFADLVVFDPEEIQGTATYEHPCQYTRGVKHLIVNGQSVVSDGDALTMEESPPGRFLKYHGG
jgi:N-acyl-D-amino-acid deacylase